MNELALFAGAGGGILGGHLLGWRTVAAVEIEDYPRRVLLQRQADGILPRFPIWDDVQTFDGKPWRGKVDVISGGFPCQDISAAGKGAGIEGERSGLWAEMARIVGEVRPSYVFVENSPLLVGRGLAVVLGDLASLGYDAKWGIVGAHHVAAPHKRDRIWILAWHSNGQHDGAERGICQGASPDSSGVCEDVADTKGEGLERRSEDFSVSGWVEGGLGKASSMANATSQRQPRPGKSWFWSDPAEKREGETDRAFAERVGKIWGIESPVGRVAHGVANRVDRLKSIGNGQVPAVAALAWEILTEGNCEPDCPGPRKKIRRTD